MTEQTVQDQMVEFMYSVKRLFAKHSDKFLTADDKLGNNDFDGFIKLYADLSQEELAEIAQVQHLKVNEIYGIMKQRSDNLMTILRDISNCKDFVAFNELQKKARAILMAQDMVDRGKPVEEVEAMMKKAETGETTQSIIVQ